MLTSDSARVAVRAPSPGRSDGAASPAEIGDSAAPQRAQASRLARSGEQRSGAPHGVLGLDDKPRRRYPPRSSRRDGKRVSSGATGERRGRHNAANLFLLCPPDGRTPEGGGGRGEEQKAL